MTMIRCKDTHTDKLSVRVEMKAWVFREWSDQQKQDGVKSAGMVFGCSELGEVQ